jgi:hypothetical protein
MWINSKAKDCDSCCDSNRPIIFNNSGVELLHVGKKKLFLAKICTFSVLLIWTSGLGAAAVQSVVLLVASQHRNRAPLHSTTQGLDPYCIGHVHVRMPLSRTQQFI